MGLDQAENQILTLGLQPAAPRPAWHRSCRRRALPRGRSSDGPPSRAVVSASSASGSGRLVGLSCPAMVPSGQFAASLSSARFSASTFTRGSPIRPKSRPAVLSADQRRHPVRMADRAQPRRGQPATAAFCGRDIGVQPRGRGGHRIGGHTAGAVQPRQIARDAVHQLFRQRAKVRSARRHGVIARAAEGRGWK